MVSNISDLNRIKFFFLSIVTFTITGPMMEYCFYRKGGVILYSWSTSNSDLIEAYLSVVHILRILKIYTYRLQSWLKKNYIFLYTNSYWKRPYWNKSVKVQHKVTYSSSSLTIQNWKQLQWYKFPRKLDNFEISAGRGYKCFNPSWIKFPYIFGSLTILFHLYNNAWEEALLANE